MHDPDTDSRIVREWFRRRWAPLQWLLRPSRCPTGLCYVLHDPESVRIARRRALCWIGVPGLLTAAVIVLSIFVDMELKETVSWYDPMAATTTPARVFVQWRGVHLFELLGRYRHPSPSRDLPFGWVEVRERAWHGIELTIPAVVRAGSEGWNDVLAPILVLALAPMVLAGIGYALPRWELVQRTAHLYKRTRLPEGGRGVLTASSLIVSVYAIGFLWLLPLIVLSSVGFFAAWDPRPWKPEPVHLSYATAVAFTCALCIGYARIVRDDGARLFFRYPAMAIAFLVFLAVVIPPVLLMIAVVPFFLPSLHR